MKKSSKKTRRYRCVVKVSDTKFVRYKVTNLLTFVRMLEVKFGGWRFMNVFDYKSRTQLASYTKRNPPTSRHVTSENSTVRQPNGYTRHPTPPPSPRPTHSPAPILPPAPLPMPAPQRTPDPPHPCVARIPENAIWIETDTEPKARKGTLCCLPVFDEDLQECGCWIQWPVDVDFIIWLRHDPCHTDKRVYVRTAKITEGLWGTTVELSPIRQAARSDILPERMHPKHLRLIEPTAVNWRDEYLINDSKKQKR